MEPAAPAPQSALPAAPSTPLPPPQRSYLIANGQLLELQDGNPDYSTNLLNAIFLPSAHKFVTLHNRTKAITDSIRTIMYARDATARMVVDDPAKFTWAQGFHVEDKPATEKVERALRAMRSALPAADRWNRLYGMGFAVLGFDDGRALSSPLAGDAKEVLWAHGFSRRHIDAIVYEKNPQSPNYGGVSHYWVRTGKPGEQDGAYDRVLVNADRILDLNENSHVHPHMGGSSLDPIWNDLEDIAAIAWANSESYWQGASPKMLFQTPKPLMPDQEKRVDDQFGAMRSNVRDYMKMLTTTTLTPLTKGSDVAQPLEHFVGAFIRLSNGSGMPFTWFFRHHLTSGEGLDWALREWYEYVQNRQHTFGTIVAEKFLRILAKAGILTKEQSLSKVVWNPPRVHTRDDIARFIRNESVGWASAGQTGFVPKELVDLYVKAPPGFVNPTLAGPTGDRDIQAEKKGGR